MGKITKRLRRDLHTEVKIDHVSLTLFNSMNLEGMLIKDLNKDTLLYAKQVKVRITDWFFLRNELILKYVGLEDAHVNMYRKDSVWNYQFLVDYFSPTTPKQKKKKSTLKFDLKKLDFKNISFVKKDLWVGSLMEARLGNMQLEADSFNLDENRIDIKQLDLDKPYFSLSNFEGLRLPVVKKKTPVADTGMYFNEGDLRLTVGKLSIKNGTFQNAKRTDRAPYPYFDVLHLLLEKISGNVSNLSFIKDTIKANIDLAAKERSGFDIRKLKTSFKLTPQIMELSKLELVTPRSHLQNYLAFHYTDFNKDFSDFIAKVTMDVRLKNSEVDSYDLSYFAPATKTWNKKISISGFGKGTVGNLAVKNLFARAGNNTTVSGDLTLTGLPDINKTIIDLQSGNLQTSYRDAATFIPAIAKVEVPSLSSLGDVKFKGNFKGTISKFETNGTFSTNLGGFSANIVMELPDKNPTIYSGHLVTQKFDLGRFLSIKDMGTLSFDGGVKGVGLSLNTLKTSVTGKIGQFNFKDYIYKKINVEGTFQRRQFDGTVKIDDENIDFVTTVKMDFRNEQPQFNVLGDLAHSNFQNLKLYNKNLEITGLFDLNFSGKNIDRFLGTVKIYNANLIQDSVRLNFDSLTLQSRFEGGRRSLSLSSNEFDAAVEGEYNILDLPNTFQTFLNKYYPAYINKPRSMAKDQEFNFILNTKNIEGYTLLFNKDLSGFSNSSITGTINTVDTVFEVNADIPDFAFKKNRFKDISINGRGNLDVLQLNGKIGNIGVGDSSYFPNTTINIISQKDQSQISIKTKANNTLNELNLNADLTTFPDGVKIKFNPSDFVLNEKRWILEKEGEIIIRKDFVSAENVRFTQNDQHISVQTTHDAQANKSNLLVELQSLNIGDFAPFLTSNPRLEGLASGNIIMSDFFGKFKIDANIKAEQFRLDNDSVGVVSVNGNYNSVNRKIAFKAISKNELYNFTADGSYDLYDSTGTPLLTSLKFDNTKVNIVNKFLSTIFTDVEGLATGELQINGNIKSPDLLGRVRLTKGSLIVNFTQVKYTVDSAVFVFSRDGIDFGKFNIKDKFGNIGQVSGRLDQHQFKDVKFDFDITSNRLLLIDTKASDNSQFYGTAIGKASMSITGPQENMHISIAAEPVDSSHIFIPITTARESGTADFIVFKQYGTEMKEAPTANETNVVVDLDLTANPLAKIDVILDPVTGDIIKAVGNGRLKIHAGTVDALTIKGRYEIQRGSYDFNFQSFIKKPFILREGANSFIEWNGDPYDAKMHVEALYVAENVRLGDLVGGQNLSGTVQGYQGNVYVIADLTGNLKQPTIHFLIDFPTGEQVKNDETFNQFLSKLEKDDNEMLKQVTYLIVFGSFAPYGEGRNIGVNFTTLGVNTISELIAKQVNNLVSNILFRITGDRSLQFDVSTTVYNSSNLFSGNVTATNAIDRQKVNFKLGKSLFNNKVVVTFGGDLDFRMGSNTATSQQLGNLQWLPDLTVEIILSKDRKLRAIVFSRNNLDITTSAVGRRNRQGASISYRKDFQNFFSKSPEKLPKNPLPTSAPPAQPATLTKAQEEEK
ncbi:translocation/assembly module TamB domain-containing protein [Segetibacter koreensis]|uniref:translocation/assembly module TamB domain-containing protein n=1 Tax=Segetibacter koreensis TaxID=398037 RepID=UPI00146A6DA5|nr:translocation/assembly module TamB domain-containing protein [Segetibacter koreensis]